LSGGKVENITALAVVQAAIQGDLAAAQILQEIARWLARALMIVIRLVNPGKIVLGGGVWQAGTALLNSVRENVAEMASLSLEQSTKIVLAELGAHSPLYGAAALALDTVE
jgi:predicted NBD/HSP70 family sugar kinase